MQTIPNTLEGMEAAGLFRPIYKFVFPTGDPDKRVVATFDAEFIECFIAWCKHEEVPQVSVIKQLRDFVHSGKCLAARLTCKTEVEISTELDAQMRGI